MPNEPRPKTTSWSDGLSDAFIQMRRIMLEFFAAIVEEGVAQNVITQVQADALKDLADRDRRES